MSGTLEEVLNLKGLTCKDEQMTNQCAHSSTGISKALFDLFCMQVEKELPETAALIRLSGLEMTDCMAEITGLGSDLSSGVRSTANMATMTEASVKQGVQSMQVCLCFLV